MIRNIPHLALIPLVILWFGIDEEAKLFLVALGVFFPIYVNTLLGIQSVDPQLVEMGRVYGMDRRALFFRVILPGALPSIFVGLRYALGIMWLTLIVAETISASSGLGYMAMQAREFLLIDVVVLSILIYALLGKLADSLARLLERLSLELASCLPERMRCLDACRQPRSRPVIRCHAAAVAAAGNRRKPARLCLQGRRQALRRQDRAGRHRSGGAGRAVPRRHRQERLRQEHAAAAARRARPADDRIADIRAEEEGGTEDAVTTARASCSRSRGCCHGRAW